MHFDVKMQENGRKNIFGYKQTTKKYRCFFLNAYGNVTIAFLDSVNKQLRQRVCI